MNKLQRARIENLKHARMLPGGPEKAFLRSMSEKLKAWDERTDRRPLSIKQHRYLARLAYKFRRQMPCGIYPNSDPKFTADKVMIEEMRMSPEEQAEYYAD